jgi:predicted nicotinamide N-methyase
MVEERVPLRSGEVTVMRPREVNDLLSEEAFAREEFMPYWAELWASGVALADDVASRALRGRRVLELGCGLGLPSIAAARAGGRVTASDWSAEAVALFQRNASLNGVRARALVSAWNAPHALLEHAPWDLVLAADVLYERRNVRELLWLLPRLVDERGEVWIADPGRRTAPEFLERAERKWTRDTIASPHSGRVSIHRLRRRSAQPGSSVASAR